MFMWEIFFNLILQGSNKDLKNVISQVMFGLDLNLNDFDQVSQRNEVKVSKVLEIWIILLTMPIFPYNV